MTPWGRIHSTRQWKYIREQRAFHCLKVSQWLFPPLSSNGSKWGEGREGKAWREITTEDEEGRRREGWCEWPTLSHVRHFTRVSSNRSKCSQQGFSVGLKYTVAVGVIAESKVNIYVIGYYEVWGGPSLIATVTSHTFLSLRVVGQVEVGSWGMKREELFGRLMDDGRNLPFRPIAIPTINHSHSDSSFRTFSRHCDRYKKTRNMETASSSFITLHQPYSLFQRTCFTAWNNCNCCCGSIEEEDEAAKSCWCSSENSGCNKLIFYEIYLNFLNVLLKPNQ